MRPWQNNFLIMKWQNMFFAKEQGIAPGIVVGRLQNEGCIKYSMLNDFKDHYEIVK